MLWSSALLRSARRFLRSLIVMACMAPYASRSPALGRAYRPYSGLILRLHQCCPSPHSDNGLLHMAAFGVIDLTHAQSCSPADGKAGLRYAVQLALRMPSVEIPDYRSMMRLISTPAAS